MLSIKFFKFFEIFKFDKFEIFTIWKPTTPSLHGQIIMTDHLKFRFRTDQIKTDHLASSEFIELNYPTSGRGAMVQGQKG